MPHLFPETFDNFWALFFGAKIVKSEYNLKYIRKHPKFKLTYNFCNILIYTLKDTSKFGGCKTNRCFLGAEIL